jgi:hypothetical protein
MQISNAASSPTPTQTAVSGNAAADPASVSADSAAPTASVTSTTGSPSQDSAVTISPEGPAIAAQEGATDGTSDASGTGTAGTADDPCNTANVSPLKSLAYGTLGLERPDQSQENRNPFYTAGRWIAAGLTIGGIISLLV